MRTALITTDAPVPFIELDAAKQHLRVDSADEDDLIEAMIAAVCGTMDGPDGTLKRAIGSQTLKLVLSSFDTACRRDRADYLRCRNMQRLELPLPPARSITEIKYWDGSNTQQTLMSSAYSLIDCGTSASFIIPASGSCWPSTYCRPDAVLITFAAGFDAEDEDMPVPAPIVAAAKLMLTNLYENRSSNNFLPGLTVAVENPAVKALLSPWRILKL